jgi:hypothetical protein
MLPLSAASSTLKRRRHVPPERQYASATFHGAQISTDTFWCGKSIIHMLPLAFCIPPFTIFSVYASLSLKSVPVGQSIRLLSSGL